MVAQIAASPRRQVFEPNYDTWTPPEELLILLQDESLRTRDKTELVCGFYAWQHNGQHPYPSEVARILGVSTERVQQAMTQLIAAGRATRKHGKFSLALGRYSNPVVERLLKDLDLGAT